MAKLLILGKETAENVSVAASKFGADLSLGGDAARIAEADIIFVSAELGLCETEKLIAESYAACKTVIVYAKEGAGAVSASFLDKINYLVCSQSALSALCGFETKGVESCQRGARALVEKGAKNVIVTAGRNGAAMAYQDGETSYPAEYVLVRDDSGCGECFAGVFAALIAEGKNVNNAIEMAINAATISVQRPGLCESFPARSEVPLW